MSAGRMQVSPVVGSSRAEQRSATTLSNDESDGEMAMDEEEEDPPSLRTIPPETVEEMIDRFLAAGVQATAVDQTRDLVQSPTMDKLKLAVNAVEHIIICRTCSCGLSMRFAEHLSKTHHIGGKGDKTHAMVVAVRKEFKLANVHTSIPAYPIVPTPRPEIEGVKVVMKVGCSVCAFHHGTAHGVANHIAARHAENPTARVIDPLRVQRVQQNVKSYIRVQAPKRNVSGVLTDFRGFMRARAQALARLPEDSRLVSPLLTRTQWHVIFRAYQRAGLISMAAFPLPTEKHLTILAGAIFDYMLYNTDKIARTERLVLQRLNTPKPIAGGLNNTPFHLLGQHETTLRLYSNEVTRLVCCLLRNDPSDPLTFSMPMSPALEEALCDLSLELYDFSTASAEHVHNVLCALWLQDWRSAGPVNSVSDPTMAYVGLQAVKKDGQYMDAHGLTGVIARLFYCIRVCALSEIHRRADSTVPKGGMVTAAAQVDAAAPLLQFVQEDNLSTFAALKSLSHYANSIVFSTPGRPVITWVDTETYTTLICHSQRISLDHLRQIVQQLQTDAITKFERVTAKLKTDIDYAQILDNPQEARAGYSALDATRPSDEAAFDRFFEALLADPTLGLTEDGKIVILQAMAWLRELGELEETLMTLVHFSSGGPARGTELACLLVRNTAERLRNMLVYGQRPVLNRDYSKTTGLQQHDKTITVSLDAVAGDLICRTHRWCRPVAEYLAKIVFGDDEVMLERYRTRLFVRYDSELTSDHLSTKMLSVSRTAANVRISLRNHRHIYTAFNRKLIPMGGDEDEEDIEDDAVAVDAEQTGHSAQTAQRLYGRANHTVGGAREDRTDLFIENSDRWASILGLVPGGYALPYYKATIAAFDSIVTAPARARRRMTAVGGGQSEDVLMAAVKALASKVEHIGQVADDIRAQLSTMRQMQTTELKSVMDEDDAVHDERHSTPFARASVPPPPAQPRASWNRGLSANQSMPVRITASSRGTFFSSQDRQSVASAPQITSDDEQDEWARPHDGASPSDDGSDADDPGDVQMRSPQASPVGSPEMRAARALPQDERNSRQRAASDVSMVSNTSSIAIKNFQSFSMLQDASLQRSAALPAHRKTATVTAATTRVAKGKQRAANVVHTSIAASTSRPPKPLFPLPDTHRWWYDEPYSNLAQIPRDDAIWILQQLLDRPDAVWKSREQRLAIILFLRLERDLAIALRTSAGKSLIAIIPSRVEKAFTIIMIPLLSLMRDWERRLKAASVGYERFRSSNKTLTGQHNIILVSVDVARYQPWKDALVDLVSRGGVIARIVIDEVQLVLTSANFRPALENMHEVRMIPVPLVLFSHNLSPQVLPYYSKEFGLTDPLVVRGLCHRAEIKYTIGKLWTDITTTVKTINALVAAHVRPGTKDRYMIYVNFKKEGRLLADLLRLPFYYSAKGSGKWPMTEERQIEIYNSWISGETAGIVTTSALSAGNDYSHVTLVVHVGTPRCSTDFEQESGRIGRDGRQGESVILPSASMPPDSTSEDVRLMRGYYVIKFIVYEMAALAVDDIRRCIRRFLLEFTSGKPMACWEIRDAALCQFCEQYLASLSSDEVEGLNSEAYIEELNPDPQPLIPSHHMPSGQASQTIIERQARFAAAVKASHQRTMARETSKADRVENYKQFLQLCRDHCGLCLVLAFKQGAKGPSPDMAHDCHRCPNLPPTEREAYYAFRKSIKYKGGHALCWTCHFSAMGSNQLHDDFKLKRHPHKRVGLMMAWGIFVDQKLKADAFADVVESIQSPARTYKWDTIDGFREWIEDKNATEEPTSVMALMDFVRRKYT